MNRTGTAGLSGDQSNPKGTVDPPRFSSEIHIFSYKMPGNAFGEGSVEKGGFALPTAEQPGRVGVALESEEFGFGQHPFSNEGTEYYF
jgi:hypothetical protein